MSYTDYKGTRLFMILGGFFIANALIAEFMGVKIFSLEQTIGINPINFHLLGEQLSLNLTAGVLLWPVVFVLSDLINEYYGPKGVRFLTNGAIVLIIYAFLMIYAAISLSPASWWTGSNTANGVPDMQAAYKAIFGQGLWIIVGSLVAFLVGQILDVYIFHYIKKKTGEKYLWLRTTGSTLISQLIDSFVVLYIAFGIGADWSASLILSVGTLNYIYKFTVAILLTPVLYWIHYGIDNYLGKEIADKLKEDAMR
jgi:queuosine precursor transporter